MSEAVAPKKISGRELDAAIAEHVMEWKRMPSQSVFAHYMYQPPDRVQCFPSSVPLYSSSIEAAMQVVEKMRLSGWSFACTLYENKLPYASFCKGTVKSSRNAEADSLPEAICRAALATVS